MARQIYKTFKEFVDNTIVSPQLEAVWDARQPEIDFYKAYGQSCAKELAFYIRLAQHYESKFVPLNEVAYEQAYVTAGGFNDEDRANDKNNRGIA